MKKIILLSAALMLFFNARVMCQLTDFDIVTFNADLVNLFNIDVTAGNSQTATFTTAADYNLGINVVGSSDVIVESTEDWFCNITGDASGFFTPSTGSGNLPIDNIGVWCEAIGTYTFGGEIILSQANTSLATALGIQAGDQMLWEVNPGNSNAGGAAENNFRLNWTMGTMNGSMNATSMMTQLANGDFTLGQYSTVITLNASQY